VDISHEHRFPFNIRGNLREEDVYDCVEDFLRFEKGTPNAAFGHMEMEDVSHDLAIKLIDGNYEVLDGGVLQKLELFEKTIPRITHITTANFY